MEKNEQKLEGFQENRKQAYNRAVNEAITLTREASSRGEEYDPADDFEPASILQARSAPVFAPNPPPER